MGRITHKTRRLKSFFRDDIWEIDLEELSKAKARAIKYLKVLMITITLLAIACICNSIAIMRALP